LSARFTEQPSPVSGFIFSFPSATRFVIDIEFDISRIAETPKFPTGFHSRKRFERSEVIERVERAAALISRTTSTNMDI